MLPKRTLTYGCGHTERITSEKEWAKYGKRTDFNVRIWDICKKPGENEEACKARKEAFLDLLRSM